jgi:hypothetical protein
MFIFFLGFLHCTLIKCSEVPEEQTLSIFRVTGLFQMGTEVIQKRKFIGYVGQLQGVWPITATMEGKNDIGVGMS